MQIAHPYVHKGTCDFQSGAQAQTRHLSKELCTTLCKEGAFEDGVHPFLQPARGKRQNMIGMSQMRGRRRAARARPGLVRPQRRNSKSAHVPTIWPLDDTTMLGIQFRGTINPGPIQSRVHGGATITPHRHRTFMFRSYTNLHGDAIRLMRPIPRLIEDLG
eukprot:gene11765-biopygen13954